MLSPQLFDHRRQGEDTNIWWPWMTLGLEQEAAKSFGIQKVPRKMQVAFLKERIQKDPHRFDANQVCALESDATAIANCLKVLIQTGDLSRANEKLLALLKEHELNGTMLRMWLRLAVGPPALVNQRQMERVFQLFALEQEPDLEFYVARLDAAMLFQGQDVALDLAEELVGEGGNRQIWAVVFWYLENGHASDAVDLVEGLMRQISENGTLPPQLAGLCLGGKRRPTGRSRELCPSRLNGRPVKRGGHGHFGVGNAAFGPFG